MSKTFVHPETIESPAGSGRWMVVIYNNEYNTIDEVVEILMRATGCGLNEAEIETWEAHHLGKCPVHFSSRLECEIVASMISSVGIRTQVRREWEEE